MRPLKCLDDIAGMLETTGRFRVLRKVPTQARYTSLDFAEPVFTGVVLDLETTGLDLVASEVVELGMIKFKYTAQGRVLGISNIFQGFQQPDQPIPEDVSRLTGIGNEMVAGCHLFPWDVDHFVSEVDLIIAHNASFDRPIAERYWPIFAGKPWACSMKDIDWRAEGCEGLKLRDLMLRHRLYHDGHRAKDDCEALLHVLTSPLPVTGGLSALALLLKQARRSTVRIWAEGADFRFKDVLRARDYRWSSGENGTVKAWSIEVDEDDVDAEVHFLFTHVYADGHGAPTMAGLTARDRFRNPAVIATRRVAADRATVPA